MVFSLTAGPLPSFFSPLCYVWNYCEEQWCTVFDGVIGLFGPKVDLEYAVLVVFYLPFWLLHHQNSILGPLPVQAKAFLHAQHGAVPNMAGDWYYAEGPLKMEARNRWQLSNLRRSGLVMRRVSDNVFVRMY